MMNYSFILAVLAAVSTAVPTPQTSSSAAVSSITSQQILQAAPGSGSCVPGGTACSTPDVAAAALNSAFEKCGYTSLGQQAALLGLMTFESVDFEYNVNAFPGRPGQGTKAMLMFNFVLKYALAQPELNSQVLELSGGSTDPNSIPDATKNEIRQLVLPDKYTFGAAPWFLSTQCDASVATQLTSGGLTAFQNYITNCVGTTFTDDRKAKWCLAYNALKPLGFEPPIGC